MKINLLLCDTFPGLLPPEIPSYASMFVDLFRSVSHNAEFEVYEVMNGRLPSETHPDEFYLITGCNRSVYEDEGWIQALLQWIQDAASAHANLVGICFGHQAISQALGGHVEQYKGGWGVGIRESIVLDENLKRFFPEGRMHLLYNHHDQVLKLPNRAITLATSDFCRYEAFRIDNHILAFQGHPEYTSAYELHLLHNHASDEDELIRQRAIASIQKYHHQGKTIAQYIIYTFIREITSNYLGNLGQR